MPIVKKYKGGWIVIHEITGLPMIEQIFKSKPQAQQAASELSRQGNFF